MKTLPLILALSELAFGQASAHGCAAISADAAKRQFDAASVKPAQPLKPPLTGNPFALTGGPGTSDPGRLTAAHAALSNLIARAYGLESDQWKGPSWLSDAMGLGYAIGATMPASTTPEEFCGMLRNLLSERLHLTFHYEKQTRPGYELTVLPDGPKFRKFVPRPAAPGDEPGRATDEQDPEARIAAMKNLGDDANGFPVLSPGQPTAMVFHISPSGDTKLSFRDTMAAFARQLAGVVNQANGAGLGAPFPRVVDKTGLAGVYDIRIEYAGIPFPNLRFGRSGDSLPPGGASAVPDPADAGPNIFTAVQKQLGLKLTKVAGVAVDVMIIDHIDRIPTEN